MKNKILFLSAFLLVIVGFSSCKKVTTAGLTEITYYPSIVMKGDNPMLVPLGSTFQDPGVYSELKGVDVTNKVKVVSNVDASKGGVYSVSYTVTSTDGFKRTESRMVIVASPEYNHDNLSGNYTANVVRNGTTSFSGNPVSLKKSSLGYGIYKISDWIGGFYAVGYGYGSNYAFSGLIQINAKNQVVLISMSNAWGYPFDSVVGTYDPATRVISYHAYWLGKYDFAVTLNPPAK